MSNSRRRALVVVAVALMAATAACGGGKKAASGRATTTAPTTTTVPPQALLTGLPLADPVKLGRPAVTVKIDNNAAARPQAGLDAADLVYEEVTEGITRFVVVFQSTDADPIGPVRSVRPADPLIVAPLNGLLAFSGGAPNIVQLVRNASITFIDENATDALYRRSGRSAPHNLYSDSGRLYNRVEDDAKAPPAFAKFLKPGETYAAAGAEPVASMDIPLADITASYEWDAGANGWKRFTNGQPHSLEAGGQWTPGNVIVQFTAYSRFAGDAAVTYPEVIGTGEAWFFCNGTLVKGTWTKVGASSVTAYSDANGAAMVFPPGRTVIELTPSNANVSVEAPPAAATTTTP